MAKKKTAAPSRGGKTRPITRLLCSADWHVHPHRLQSQDNGRDRMQDGLSALDQSLSLAQEHDAAWVGCGDFKQPRTIWPQEALNGIRDAFLRYPSVPKLLIPGNHDGLGEWGSGLAPFRELALVVEQPSFIDVVGGRPLKDCMLACWPWGSPEEHRARFLDDARACPVAPILLSHGFLAGVFLGPDDVRLPGVGLTLAQFGMAEQPFAFDAAVFGDIHKGQMLVRGPKQPMRWVPYTDVAEPTGLTNDLRSVGPWRGEIFYPGSPYQQSWGEVNEWPKGCLLMEPGTGSVRLLSLKSPRYWDLEMDVIQLERSGSDGRYRDGFVRLTVPLLAHDDPGKAAALAERAHERWAPRTFQVSFPRTQAERVLRSDLHAGMSTEQLLTGYIEARPPEEDLPVPFVLEAGRRLVQEES